MSELRLSDGAGGIVALRLESAPLGSGGDGSVYASTSHPELVAKLYHDPGRVPERRRKLLAMLQTPPQLDPIHHGGHPYVQLTWPTHLVEDAEGRFLGFAMPRVELDRAELAETLLSRKTRKAYRLPEAYGLRVTAASNLAAVVEALHARGHHVVDLKPVNAYVYRDTFFVALLDCDGSSVQGASGERFPAHQYTPDYIAPEALAGKLPPEALGEAQDRFALAVVVFQLLNGGVHPFQGVPVEGVPVPPSTTERMARWMYAYGRRPNPFLRPSPWSIHESFDDGTRVLFDRAFGEDPAARPDAAEWRAHLARYADPATGALRRCAADPAHALFGDGPSAECFQCALDARRGDVQATQPAPAPAPAPGPAAQPASAGKTAPPPVRPAARPAGVRRWLEANVSGALVVGSVVMFGGAAVLDISTPSQAPLATAPASGPVPATPTASAPAPPPVPAAPRVSDRCTRAWSAVPPDTVGTLLARAAVPGISLDELRSIDWSYADAHGRNAVHWSVRLGNHAATMGMVQGGAPVDLPDADGVTPLMVAAGRADLWQVAVLLDGGADVDAANAAGQTPLMYLAGSCTPVLDADATLLGSEPALLRLVAAGAALDVWDHRGHTALMHATRGSGLRVRDLLAAGANPHFVDRAGRTALQIAATPVSLDAPYIQALLERAASAGDWSALPPERREQILASVEGRGGWGSRANRDHAWRPPELPADSVFILPLRP